MRNKGYIRAVGLSVFAILVTVFAGLKKRGLGWFENFFPHGTPIAIAPILVKGPGITPTREQTQEALDRLGDSRRPEELSNLVTGTPNGYLRGLSR